MSPRVLVSSSTLVSLCIGLRTHWSLLHLERAHVAKSRRKTWSAFWGLGVQKTRADVLILSVILHVFLAFSKSRVSPTPFNSAQTSNDRDSAILYMYLLSFPTCPITVYYLPCSLS
ncbi:unnamed protein product [Ixodes persulcatus]